MRAFFDTEHIKIYSTPLTLASIGILREDGEQLYMVSSEFKRSKSGAWFKKNVWPHLADEYRFTTDEIAFAVQSFLTPVRQLVTRGGKNDWPLLTKLLGGLPYSKIDIEKAWDFVGRPILPSHEGRHHAMDDAHYHRDLYKLLCDHVQAANLNPHAEISKKFAEIQAVFNQPRACSNAQLKALEDAAKALQHFTTAQRKYQQGVNMLRVPELVHA